MVSEEEQKVLEQLNASWVWVPQWIDAPEGVNTAGKIVVFTRFFDLDSPPTRALLHFSADTRYKLYVNSCRAAIGPARSSPLVWYHDTLDIAPLLRSGSNEVKFVVMRYFASVRAALPFARTVFPGFTVVGNVELGSSTASIDISTSHEGWTGSVLEQVTFPMGLVDDVFLHISERGLVSSHTKSVVPFLYNFKTLNGELSPWRLCPRPVPIPVESRAAICKVPVCASDIASRDWLAMFADGTLITLPENSKHTLDVQAEVHSTALVQWMFRAASETQVSMKIMYSEGYELEPRAYPFFRTKADRLDSSGHLIGSFDEVTIQLEAGKETSYEPFWFRTFRLMRLEITVGSCPVDLLSFNATQVNYPLAVKGSWREPNDSYAERMWDVSIRTMRNCMFDGYSDCPFYEQLQSVHDLRRFLGARSLKLKANLMCRYAGDSRTVGLFHYLISGDDRLMRQTIATFAASVTLDGLTQSRFPSHVPQIIAGFSLIWILQVCDHHLYFGDNDFARSFLPRIDGVLAFFQTHVDELGLVSGMPKDVWQYVDWVTTWAATEDHPDKGVPTSGRKSNRHTYFSMLYAYVLQKAAHLIGALGRQAVAAEYEVRANALLEAIRKHCYDGDFFTDSTADIADELSYSQHCQIFAVLSGAASKVDHKRLLMKSFANARFSKCSYMMMFYALRSLAIAGDDVYESMWSRVWKPWHKMLDNNLTTWEEDDVRQRSDCHAWGSVPLYEFCTELAGVHILGQGASKVLFKPRPRLAPDLDAKVALGAFNVATVSWKTISTSIGSEISVSVHFEQPVELITKMPHAEEVVQGLSDSFSASFAVQ